MSSSGAVPAASASQVAGSKRKPESSPDPPDGAAAGTVKLPKTEDRVANDGTDSKSESATPALIFSPSKAAASGPSVEARAGPSVSTSAAASSTGTATSNSGGVKTRVTHIDTDSRLKQDSISGKRHRTWNDESGTGERNDKEGRILTNSCRESKDQLLRCAAAIGY